MSICICQCNSGLRACVFQCFVLEAQGGEGHITNEKNVSEGSAWFQTEKSPLLMYTGMIQLAAYLGVLQRQILR